MPKRVSATDIPLRSAKRDIELKVGDDIDLARQLYSTAVDVITPRQRKNSLAQGTVRENESAKQEMVRRPSNCASGSADTPSLLL